MKFTSHLILALGLSLAGIASAQNDSAASAKELAKTIEKLTLLKGEVSGLNESYLETKSIVDKLARIKVGGYIQGQWQLATSNYNLRDSTTASDSVVSPSLNGGGIPMVAGGNFPGQTNQRFQIRRARLKTTYEGVDAKYVLEIDAIPSGVSVKDAYVQWTEPWLKTFSLTLGNMDQPFGFEIGYSSSVMESPERSRLENVIFKGEKALGAKIEINPTEQMDILQYFNLKAGLYTGTEGSVNGNGDEVDRGYDVMGRAGFKVPFADLGLAIDGGVSGLYGKTQVGSDTVYNVISGDTAFLPSLGNKPKWGEWKYESRTAIGGDVQVYFDAPVIGGMSLRAEYVQGTQPGSSGSANPYSNNGVTNTANASVGSMYVREYRGYYIQYVQNIGDRVQGVIRFDNFDPNTKVDDKDITAPRTLTAGKKALGLTDLSYNTLGLGATYHWDANLKFLLYYDMPMNAETYHPANTTKLTYTPYRHDINDNVLTARMQVKF